MNLPLSQRAICTGRRQKSGHNGLWSNCSCCVCTASVWSSPCDTGYVLMLHIHGLKSSIDINKELTVSLKYGLLYIYIYISEPLSLSSSRLSPTRSWMVPDRLTCWVLEDVMEVDRENLIIWRTSSWDLHQLMPLAPIPFLLSALSVWWSELLCRQILRVFQLLCNWSPVPAHYWPMITLLVSPKGKTHKGSISLWS